MSGEFDLREGIAQALFNQADGEMGEVDTDPPNAGTEHLGRLRKFVSAPSNIRPLDLEVLCFNNALGSEVGTQERGASMRDITVDIDVFSAIWRHRRHGEFSENEVLRRLLLGDDEQDVISDNPFNEITPNAEEELKSSNLIHVAEATQMENVMGKIRWVDDVQQAIKSLGGHASLHQIYGAVRARRREGGRSLPRTFEAIIRRTLEDHSSDSANFKSDDLFKLIGRGEWGLR